MTFNPTPQQQAIEDATMAGHSIIVTARAGCAKTTTLTTVAHKYALEHPTKRGLALAFNTKIAKELKDKFPDTFTCITLNGLGHRAWGAGRRLKLDTRKLSSLLDEYLTQHKLSATWDEKTQIRSIVDRARINVLVPRELPGTGFLLDTAENWNLICEEAETFFKDEGKKAETLHIARGLLKLSIQRGFDGLIDFSDQIYLPVAFGGRWPEYDIKMGDEVQDWSAANHKMVKNVGADQALLVGDPKQAIYAFRGALSDSMQHLEKCMPEETQWKHLYLTKTFRCGKAIVARQKSFVPDFEAAEGNSVGKVEHWPKKHTQDPNIQNFENTWTPSDVPDGSAILCRNNAPLISCALKFLRAKRKVTVLGRDFAEKLKKDVNKACGKDPGMPMDLVHTKLKAFYEKQIAGEKKPTQSQLDRITERVDAILAFSEDIDSLGGLLEAIDNVFSDDIAPVTLATGHKAKGLEWDFVIHLNPWMIPSRWAKESGDQEALDQEDNLRYVIETRARHTLILANLDDLEV